MEHNEKPLWLKSKKGKNRKKKGQRKKERSSRDDSVDEKI